MKIPFLDTTVKRFIIVGIINTAVGTAVMFSFYNIFHLGYWFSSASNYVIGSIVSYILNKNYTFENKEKGIKPLLRFTVNILVCYLLAYGIAKPLVHLMLSGFSATIRDNAAMLVGMGLFVILNYVGQRFFAFKEKN